MAQRIKLILACTLVFGLVSVAIGAQADKEVYTDPAKAGPDFTVQGEYAGPLQTEEGKRRCGAQVVALGGGKFDLVIYTDGLPGAGWKRGGLQQKMEGARKDRLTTFSGSGGSAQIEDGVLSVKSSGGETLGKLKRVERKSPTLGAKPPKGAVVLFDGKTTDHFIDGHMTADKLLMPGCDAKQKFGDHSLHVEFRTPFKPRGRGQGRGNSGVYVQGRYEVQVLDSFGLSGENNECGGVYSIKTPDVNMCYPPLTWQTYDILFKSAQFDGGKRVKGARLTVRHNGVVIHDDYELPRGTPGRHAEGPGPEALFLQGHGNPVVFRNIWVVEK